MTLLRIVNTNARTKAPFDIYENPYIKTHLEAIKNERYRLSSEGAYRLLATMLWEDFSICILDTQISENEYGKPVFSNTDLHFNLSHSENICVCAISHSPVGVDVEHIRNTIPKAATRVLSQEEYASCNTPQSFFRLWTLKEAYLKALGTGINRKLSEISFDLTHSDPAVLPNTADTESYSVIPDTSIILTDAAHDRDFEFYLSLTDTFACAVCTIKE